MGREFFDIVSKQDKVIGRIDKATAHQTGALHRAVHVFVFNKKGQLLLGKRSKKKLLAPGLWDSSVGEHAKAGETYEKAAIRGLKEELGIRTKKVKKLFKIRINDKTSTYHNREFIMLFEKEFNGKVKPNSESEKTAWFSIKALKSKIKKNQKVFCGAFLAFFKKYSKGL